MEKNKTTTTMRIVWPLENSRITIIDTSSLKMELNLAHRMSITCLLCNFILLYFMSSFFFVSQKYLSFCFFYSSLRIEDVQNAHTNLNEIKKTQHHQVSMRLHVICIRWWCTPPLYARHYLKRDINDGNLGRT